MLTLISASSMARMIGEGNHGSHCSSSNCSIACSQTLLLLNKAVRLVFGQWVTGNQSTGNTWTGLTEDSDFVNVTETSQRHTTASNDFATQQAALAVAADLNVNTEPVGVFASWQPSSASPITATPRGSLLLLGVGR